jgi:PAS domain-containing protein
LTLPDTQTGALLRSTDWSLTPLGPLERWPQSLRIAVGICLNSRFPMFVWWGPELINIYNDAYIPILGKRHPAAFGRPAPTIWGEIWHVVGPQAEAVMRRGEATWNERVLLVMERHGYTEDTWFTWSYSPIPDEAGGIGGVFCACTEDTPRVLVERERDELLAEVELERRRLEEAFRQSPAFLAVLRGREHVFHFVNDRYRQLIGQREVIGKPVREALPEIEGQGFFEILDRVCAGTRGARPRTPTSISSTSRCARTTAASQASWSTGSTSPTRSASSARCARARRASASSPTRCRRSCSRRPPTAASTTSTGSGTSTPGCGKATTGRRSIPRKG